MILILICILIGYLLSRVTLRSRALAVAFAPLMGLILLAGVGYLYRYQAPQNTGVFWLAFVLALGLVVWMERTVSFIRVKNGWEHLVFTCIGGCMTVVTVINQLCADQTTHAYIVKQIQLNHWPLKGMFPGDVLLKYHFGYDGVVAMVSSVLKVEYLYVMKGGMLLMLMGIYFAFSVVLEARGVTREKRYIGLLFLTVASGLATFMSFTNWYTLLALLNVPSTISLMGMTIWYVLFFDRQDVCVLREGMALLGVTVVIGLGAPIYSSIMIAFFFFLFAFCMLYLLLNKKYGLMVAYGLSGLALVVFWKFTKVGMLIDSAHYESMKPMLAFQAFDSLGEYWHYMKRDVFFIIPMVALAVVKLYQGAIHWEAVKKMKVVDGYMLLGLMTVLVPFVFVFPYISPTDNFIKISCIGMVCGVILMMDFFKRDKYGWVQYLSVGIVLLSIYRSRSMHYFNRYVADQVFIDLGFPIFWAVILSSLGLCIGAIALFLVVKRKGFNLERMMALLVVGIFLSSVTFGRSEMNRAWKEQIGHYSERYCVHPNLVKWCRGNLNHTNMVFSPTEVKERFVLYYINHSTQDYSPYSDTKIYEEISALAGIPLLNNCNWSYAILPELERPLWNKFYDWYVNGNHTNIRDFQADYLIYPIKELPGYVQDLLERKEITLAHQDDGEGWVMYKVL